MKTAVLRYTESHNLKEEIEKRRATLAQIKKPALDDYMRLCSKTTLDLVASFQRALVDDVVTKTLHASRECNVATLFVTGGVAANSELRRVFEQRAAQDGIVVAFPSRKMSTDNAAMIAAAAYPKFLAADFAEEDFSAEAGLVLR